MTDTQTEDLARLSEEQADDLRALILQMLAVLDDDEPHEPQHP